MLAHYRYLFLDYSHSHNIHGSFLPFLTLSVAYLFVILFIISTLSKSHIPELYKYNYKHSYSWKHITYRSIVQGSCTMYWTFCIGSFFVRHIFICHPLNIERIFLNIRRSANFYILITEVKRQKTRRFLNLFYILFLNNFSSFSVFTFVWLLTRSALFFIAQHNTVHTV
jgi:hypothetical protein